MRELPRCLRLVALVWVCGCQILEARREAVPAETPVIPLGAARALASIDDARLRDAGQDPQNWITHGRTYSEQRFSPLSEITASNVGQLGLAWSFDTDTDRGLEATPLVVGRRPLHDRLVERRLRHRCAQRAAAVEVRPAGAARDGPQGLLRRRQSRCRALQGQGLRRHARRAADRARRDDGRAAVGSRHRRSEQALHDHRRAARRRRQGDHRQWRRRARRARLRLRLRRRDAASSCGASTPCPAIPSQPFESPALERAAKTWKGGEWWKIGGGGTVWDSMAYDPELRLLYVGTGNGSPWSRYVRSPGGGDNLFLSSILALRPDTGELRLALPGNPGRHLGLHGDATHDPRRAADRRPAAQGPDARAEERLLLRARSRDRRAALGREVRRAELGRARRPEDRPAGRGQGPRLPQADQDS